MDVGALLDRLRRAEFFGDGLGIHVGAHELGLAHLSKRFFRVALRDYRTVPLPGKDHPVDRRHVLADAVLSFVRECRLDGAPVFLSVPRSEAVFNRLALPAAAADSLAQVIEYELERVIPLPKEEVHYAFTTRPFGADRLEVLLMCIPRAVLREHLDALEDAFVRPRGVVVASAAIADFFCFCQQAVRGPVGFLVGGNGDLEFTLIAEGRIVSSLLLPRPLVRAEADLARLLARELTDELVGVEDVLLYQWRAGNGSGPPEALLGAAELVPLARERLEAPAEFFETRDAGALLPAVGAALDAVHEGTVAVNLLPAESRGGAESAPGLLTMVLLLLAALLGLAWGVSTVVRDEMESAALEAEIARIGPRVEEIKREEEAAAELRGQVESLTAADGRRAVLMLEELTKLIPDDAYLTTFRLHGQQVQLDGFARAAADLISKIEGSERFKNVKFTSPTTKAQGLDRYSITMELE
jgi:Tfp pilus assembly protein PilN